MTDNELRLATQKTLNEAIEARMTLESLLALQALPTEERTKAALQLSNLALAYRKITTTRIEVFRQELRDNAIDLQSGIDVMKESLAEIENAKKMIASTSQFLGVISRILVLL